MRHATVWGVFAAWALGAFCMVPPAIGAEFHVSDTDTFQDALMTAGSNGEDDIIVLNLGIYNEYAMSYLPAETEHRDLTITGAPGTRPEDVVLDGSGFYWPAPPLNLWDLHYDDEYGPEANIIINGITVRNRPLGEVNGGAGGIDIVAYAYNVTISNCIVQDNVGEEAGGGISIETLYGVVLENNVIVGNTLERSSRDWAYGGGVMITVSIFGDVILRNNLIADNTVNGGVDHAGGGVYIAGNACSSGPSIFLYNNTICNNSTGGEGGGLYVYAGRNLYAYNNILYGNTAGEGNDIYLNVIPGDRVSYHNDYSELAGNAWTEEAGRTDADPLFVNTALYDYHLRPDSPVIDTGTSTVPDPPGLPSTDAEGAPRITGTAPDRGAYEWMAAPRPRIRLNGADGFIELLTYEDTLRFDLSLDNAGLSDNADWWLMMISPYGIHFATLTGWTTAWEPWFQWPLFYVGNFSTYDVPLGGWLPGYYLFFFGVDTVMDGLYTTSHAYYDYIAMKISD